MVWVGSTLKTIMFQQPCHGQEQHPSEQVAQSSMQPGLEHPGNGKYSDFRILIPK